MGHSRRVRWQGEGRDPRLCSHTASHTQRRMCTQVHSSEWWGTSSPLPLKRTLSLTPSLTLALTCVVTHMLAATRVAVRGQSRVGFTAGRLEGEGEELGEGDGERHRRMGRGNIAGVRALLL